MSLKALLQEAPLQVLLFKGLLKKHAKSFVQLNEIFIFQLYPFLSYIYQTEIHAVMFFPNFSHLSPHLLAAKIRCCRREESSTSKSSTQPRQPPHRLNLVNFLTIDSPSPTQHRHTPTSFLHLCICQRFRAAAETHLSLRERERDGWW